MKTRTRVPPRRAALREESDIPIYLDYNATTPLDESVLSAMIPYLKAEYGNAASRTHALGNRALAAVDDARARVARLVGAEPRTIVWTSGATESNNLAIKGIAFANRERGRHLITQATEHPSVLDTFKDLKENGFDVTVLPVGADGRIKLSQLASALTDRTTLVSLMTANNETGVVQPVAEAAKLCQSRGVPIHTDATQAAGRLPVDVRGLGVDLLSMSAHKMYGPKGIGAIYIRGGSPLLRLRPLIHGGGHERGFRSGTLNVPAIVGFGAAADLARKRLPGDADRMNRLRETLEHALVDQVGAIINGAESPRLPNTSSVSIPGVDADAALVGLPRLAMSSGSACTSALVEPSHVLVAMGLPPAQVRGTIRVSLGRSTSATELTIAIDAIVAVITHLRALRSA